MGAGLAALDLDAVWGCFLQPTGGIVGAGNQCLMESDTAQPIVIHAVIHDAFGYLYNYHGVGPGYNYLGTYFTVSPTSSPMACQYAGIWTARTRKIANGTYRFGDILGGSLGMLCQPVRHTCRGAAAPGEHVENNFRAEDEAKVRPGCNGEVKGG